MTQPVAIEQGYFIFTLMPSLACSLNCPHCYLTLTQRRSKDILPVEGLVAACEKIHAYYEGRRLAKKTIVCYWYGGEPTDMGQDYFTRAADAINDVFAQDRGYDVKHTVLSSLITADASWHEIFRRYGKGEVQSSYDGLMRGKGYMRRWDKAARAVIESGLRLATISVVNRALLEQGPAATLDYLADLGVAETAWLPFMLNEQNAVGGKYENFAPSMDAYSDFMIAMSEHWLKRKECGLFVPQIGQMRFILGQQRAANLFSNIAGQTLFLLPDGSFVLPDYKNGWQEFMQPFGNILTQSFEEILTSPARRAYLRRQTLRNGNTECLECTHADKCVMEFWKPNRPGDDCFGARRYVEWVVANAERLRDPSWENSTLLY